MRKVKRYAREKFAALRLGGVAKNTIFSYIAFGSNLVTGLLMLPLVTYFLSIEELGVWALVYQVMLYLSFIDAGVNASMGRMMAPAILNNDKCGDESMVDARFHSVDDSVCSAFVSWL